VEKHDEAEPSHQTGGMTRNWVKVRKRFFGQSMVGHSNNAEREKPTWKNSGVIYFACKDVSFSWNKRKAEYLKKLTLKSKAADTWQYDQVTQL